MKKVMICFLATIIFSCSPISLLDIKGFNGIKKVFASGIPVIDVAHISQTLTGYITQLSEYAESIANSSTNAQQLAQMIQGYTQTLREYQHYLNQMESVRNSISNQDWDILMQQIQGYYGQSARGVVATMDVNSGSYENDLDTVLGNYGYVPRDPSQVQVDAQALGIWSPQFQQDVNTDFETFDLYKDRMRLVSSNADKTRKREEDDIPTLTNTLSSLGDESDLQTLQLIAAQNMTAIKQKQQELDMLNQQLAYEQNQDALEAAKRAKALNDEINRLQNKQRTSLPALTRFGRF